MHAAQPALPDLNTTPDDIRSLLRSLEKSLQNIEKKVDNLEGVSRRAERLAIVVCNVTTNFYIPSYMSRLAILSGETERCNSTKSCPLSTTKAFQRTHTITVIDDLSSTQLMSYLDGYVIAYPQGASHQEKLWKLKLFLGVWVGN
ncbi:hypothetical protein DXG01_010329 [Tephrocybe rancida]|nr:hypothetical protein DXG01_010329 [Tephrocybe rancida]